MRRKVLSIGVLLVCSLFPASKALTGPIVGHEYTFYSDYFVTAVGGATDPCDDDYSEWGTQDGLYWRDYWYGCGGNAHGYNCAQKIDGVWTTISCP